MVTFDPDCPVKISDPVCARPSTSTVALTLTPSTPNTLAIVAGSVSAVVISVVVTMVISVLVVCLVN